MTVLVDSSFLYALLNDADEQHAAVVAVFGETLGPWLMPSPAVTEVAHLVAKYQGAETLAAFLETLPISSPQLVEPSKVDYPRAAQLIRQYRDAPLDFVDSLLIAIAERLNVTTVLTLDRHHFHMVRPRHCTAFEVLP